MQKMVDYPQIQLAGTLKAQYDKKLCQKWQLQRIDEKGKIRKSGKLFKIFVKADNGPYAIYHGTMITLRSG